jgi:hypothetical protein
MATSTSRSIEGAPDSREDWLAWQRAMSEGWNIASAVVKPFASALNSFKDPVNPEDDCHFSLLYLTQK